MPKLSKAKVRAMLPVDRMVVWCDSLKELDSVYQTALQVRQELNNERRISVSRSGVTLAVTIRTGI